jgi:serine protease Do
MHQEPFADAASRVGPQVVQVRSGRGFGSGVLLDSRSVVTNAHVVGRGRSPSITFADGVTRTGQVCAVDRAYDLALVEVDSPVAGGVALAPEEAIVPGKQVVAIGNPYGFGWTVTAGVVSAVERIVGPLDGLIQTDAAINPGNSGGALVDLDGRLVGIPTLTLSRGQNIGFAIPSWQVDLIVSQFRESGRAEHPWVGIRGTTEVVDPALARLFDLPSRGVVVLGVELDGPAERAGLQEFDMIIRMDRYDVKSIESLRRAVRRTRVGERVPVLLLRGGLVTERTLRIAEMPGTPVRE